jgi:hypothetical protein
VAADLGDTWDFISDAPDFHVAMSPLLDIISFIQAMNEFIPHIADQQTIRVKAQINKEKDPVAIAEYGFEIEEIIRRDHDVWPQIVWGSMLVSIYAAFEHGIEQSFRNWRSVFDTAPVFTKKSRQDFLAAADEYATTQIKIPLFPDNEHRHTMMHLKHLRNSYVHNGCRVSHLPKNTQSKLIESKFVGCRIIGDGEETKWISDARTSLFFALRAKTIIRLFGENGFNAYDLRSS